MLRSNIGNGVWFILALFLLSACKTTESTGLRDYSNGVQIAVAASAENPTYTISETVGAAGSGYAYLLEETGGRWRMMYDSFDAKVFAKPAGNHREVPVGSEVLWTDGNKVVVYFGTEPLSYSKVDGSFSCPKSKDVAGHRACRSQFTEAKSLLDGLVGDGAYRPFVLDVDEIKKAIVDTRIVAIAKKRLARNK